MKEISPGDWDDLQALASRVGFPTERVGLLRRRFENSAPRPDSPYVLVVGRPSAGIELFFSRWFNPEVAEELRKAKNVPLVIGATPNNVQPKIGLWPTRKSSKIKQGHLIALCASGKPPVDVLAQLASLIYMDELILVTRLGQPLHIKEREIAETFASLAATARVLIVGVPGEEPTQSELAEVIAYTISQMRQLGFSRGRCLGAGVWFTDDRQRPGTINDIETFLTADQKETAEAKPAMAQQAVVNLFDELEQKAKVAPSTQQAVISDDESDRLVRDLDNYLSDLGRELDRQAQNNQTFSTEMLRAYARDVIRGWGAYTTVEGFWLKYIERLRPGTQAAFFTEAESALSLLNYEPGSGTEDIELRPQTAGLTDRIILEAKRLILGLVFGLAAYLVTVNLLASSQGATGSAQGGINLPPVVTTLIAYIALVIGGVAGYGAGRRFFKESPMLKSEDVKSPVPAAMHGWQQVQRRLTAWFANQIRAKQTPPFEECHQLAVRLGIKEINK